MTQKGALVTHTYAATATGIAREVQEVVRAALGTVLPVRLVAWDGSQAGRTGDPVVRLNSADALRHLVWRPGELGLARAYIDGTLDVDGDLGAALSTVRRALDASPRRSISPLAVPRLIRTGARLGALGRPPDRPPEEARLSGRRHSPARDRAAIGHHYDLGNDVYELLLDDTMSYSCGYWASTGCRHTPESGCRHTPESGCRHTPESGCRHTPESGGAASRAKLDLVCHKLGLQPGSTLVDVGCGWGSLVIHAARHYGARVTGYTISAAQGAYVRDRISHEGLGDLASVQVRDYRDLGPWSTHPGPVDAVASIEMGEHVGDQRYPEFAAILYGLLRPGGRLLLQQMSRGKSAPGGGAFIESYIAPDMHMRPLGETIELLSVAGLEIRDVEAMREHYVRTVRAWATRVEEHWGAFVALAGERTARIWRLYLAGGALAFEENRMGVDQILAVRPELRGHVGMTADRRGHGRG